MSEETTHHPKHKYSFELTPPVSIIIAGLIIAGAIVYTNSRPTPVAAGADQAGGPTATANVPMPSSSDHIIGSPTAPIVLVEYSDFQCPYCQMIHPSLKQIVSESQGQVAWVMREYPLYQIHPNAMPGADAAECIAEQKGNDAFWKFTDTVFADQSKISPEYFAQLAQGLGVNMTTYNSCVTSHKYANKINQEISDAQSSGGNGTPYTVIINTKTGKQYPIAGALPLAQLKAAIEQVQAAK